MKEIKENGGVGKIDDSLLNEVQAARIKFDTMGGQEIELAMEESLALFEQQTGFDALTEQAIQASLQQNEKEAIDAAMINSTIQASTKDIPDEDPELLHALQMSEMELLPASVKQVLLLSPDINC